MSLGLWVADFCCGLGGWAEGFLAEGFEVVGFDTVERPYPGHLVIQDVRTLAGFQFERAAAIVASPPCNEFSYRSLPWGRLTTRSAGDPDLSIFRACQRIAAEARRPIVIENVRGAERWVGPAAAHVGSFYLWGDVPALLPIMRAEKGMSLSRKYAQRPSTGPSRLTSQGKARAEWSAQAAKIPFELARHIARCFKP